MGQIKQVSTASPVPWLDPMIKTYKDTSSNLYKQLIIFEKIFSINETIMTNEHNTEASVCLSVQPV